MQAQIIRENQLVAKEQMKMFTFGLKVALLQNWNDVSASSQRRHAWWNINLFEGIFLSDDSQNADIKIIENWYHISADYIRGI